MEKIQIKCDKFSTFQNSLRKNSLLTIESNLSHSQRWGSINYLKSNYLSNETQQSLIIYPYSISNNFLKEVFSRIGVKFTLTNNIRKASLIIGCKRQLQQNPVLKQLALRNEIPIYSFKRITIYQLKKLITFLV